MNPKRLKNASVADVARLLGVTEEKLRVLEKERDGFKEAHMRHDWEVRGITGERDELRKKLEAKDAYISDLQQAVKDAQSPIVDKIRDLLKRLGEDADASNVHGLGSGCAALMRVLEARCLAAGE